MEIKIGSYFITPLYQLTTFPSKELTILPVLCAFLKAALLIFLRLKSQDPAAVKQWKSPIQVHEEGAFVVSLEQPVSSAAWTGGHNYTGPKFPLPPLPPTSVLDWVERARALDVSSLSEVYEHINS